MSAAEFIPLTAATNGIPAAQWLAPMLLVLGIVIVSVLLAVSMREKVRQRQASRPAPREHIEQIKASRRDPGLHAQAAEMVQSIQRLAAQLDAKAERLEQLIVQADERLAALGATSERPDARTSEEEEMRQAGSGSQGAARRPADGTPAHGLTDSPANARAAEPADPLTRSVYELADAGRSPVEIARALDEHTGKVELILALRGR